MQLAKEPPLVPSALDGEVCPLFALAKHVRYGTDIWDCAAIGNGQKGLGSASLTDALTLWCAGGDHKSSCTPHES